jgi:hypothetical protein
VTSVSPASERNPSAIFESTGSGVGPPPIRALRIASEAWRWTPVTIPTGRPAPTSAPRAAPRLPSRAASFHGAPGFPIIAAPATGRRLLLPLLAPSKGKPRHGSSSSRARPTMVDGPHRRMYPLSVGLPRLMPQRRTLAKMLRSYGEHDLAERSLVTTDEELDRIAVLGAHYAFSEVAMQHGGSMGGARALSLAALDVLEGSDRDLRQTRSQAELSWGLPETLDHDEVEQLRMVRLTAPQ